MHEYNYQIIDAYDNQPMHAGTVYADDPEEAHSEAHADWAEHVRGGYDAGSYKADAVIAHPVHVHVEVAI